MDNILRFWMLVLLKCPIQLISRSRLNLFLLQPNCYHFLVSYVLDPPISKSFYKVFLVNNIDVNYLYFQINLFLFDLY